MQAFFWPKFWRLTEALSLQSIEFFCQSLSFFGKVLEFFPSSLLYVLYKHIFLLWKALASTEKCEYIAKIYKHVHKNDILGINPNKYLPTYNFFFWVFWLKPQKSPKRNVFGWKMASSFLTLSFFKTVKKSLH